LIRTRFNKGIAPVLIETDRLIIRRWQEADRVPFAQLNADPEVMRFFPSVLSADQSNALIDTARRKTEKDGFCFSPIEEKSSGTFLGFVGLSVPAYAKPLPFDPCVEVGWRLARNAWGNGYASEAARAWLRFGFETLGLEEIVSFTARQNRPSRRVMERIGMTHDPKDDFDHPMLPTGHALQGHVLYRLHRTGGLAANRSRRARLPDRGGA
jgi:RimJ/RimL family protein N-acetyltransferase